jgi:NAD(P)-dependent dehydrogenase (short-subunit alcohol dehydrogenase family)
VFTQEVDVSDEARVVQGMAEAVEEMGRVDGVIANAGMMRNEGSFAAMSSEAWHSLLAVNQHGAFYTIREGARHMKRRYDAGDPGGSLLFCASLSALTGSPGMQHYNASKGAMVAMSRGIAVEAGRYGIRCNVVCPGHTVSETVDIPDDHPVMERVRRYNPMGRMGTPADFEGIGVYFMSDLSSFHTGDVVIVEGGWMANAGKSDISELPPWP